MGRRRADNPRRNLRFHRGWGREIDERVNRA
jgi:hypothetical protein